MEDSSRIVHAGRGREPGSPSAPPIVPASFFTSSGDPASLGYAYARDGNPTWEALEEALGALEDAQAVAFASGQAATLALMLLLAEEGRRLVLPVDGYYGTRVLARRLAGFGVDSATVDQSEPDTVRAALANGPTALWVETPTNPLLSVVDLEQLGRLAADAGAPMVADNTVATGVLQRPLDLGATATLTSLTKGASGHSDVVLGAVAARHESLLERLRDWRATGGGIPGPFETWLVHRGLQTLPLRAVRQSETALTLARYLTGHRRVRRAYYPSLDPATSELAERQMPNGFGPLLSFELDGKAEDADRVVTSSLLIRPATSLGGVESTWERRSRWPSETAPPSLIRLSVGLEAAADLLGDLERALETAG